MAQTKVKLISDGVIVQGNLHSSHGITTAHIGEGSNLYYTDARVGSYLSTNSFATESYVGTQITNLVDSSPATLNTLNELAAALGDDPNFATTTANSIGLKAPLAGPSFTGNATFAGQVNVNSDFKVNGSTGEDSLTIAPQAAGSGVFLLSLNAAGSAYEPFRVDAESYNFTNAGTSVISTSGLNTTFAGSVSAEDNIYLTDAGTVRAKLLLNASDRDNVELRAESLGSTMKFFTVGTEALELDASQNATFAGTVQTTQITATNGLNYLKRNTDASLQLRSENTRSGLFITKPATDTVMGSALVLADESYRLGTASYYHMYMLQNGNTYFTQNVGIGTTSPGAKLEINNGSTQTELRISVTGDTGYSTINFSDASDINPGQIYYHHQQNLMNFRTNDNDRMVINSSGNVGINQTSPSFKLDVNGTGYFSDLLRVDEPVYSYTNSGTKHYTHLATGSLYGSGASAAIITTNIPGHNISGNGNMFSFKIVGYAYTMGIIDMTVGMYAGENNYYSVYWSGTCQENWIGNVYVFTNSAGAVCIQLGEVTDVLNCEIAVTDFVQGFGNVNANYSKGWSIAAVTTLPTQNQKTTLNYKTILPDVYEDVTFHDKVGIGTVSPTRKLDVAGEITHEGLVPKNLSAGDVAFIDGLVTINKTVSTTANVWTSLDISLSNIGGTGTFAVQVYSNAHGGGTNAAWYNMYWSGIMSWYHSSVNDDDIDEIPLHMAGHARNNGTLELRTKLHTADGTSYANRCELQIKTVNALSSAPISFRFRKLL